MAAMPPLAAPAAGQQGGDNAAAIAAVIGAVQQAPPESRQKLIQILLGALGQQPPPQQQQLLQQAVAGVANGGRDEAAPPQGAPPATVAALAAAAAQFRSPRAAPAQPGAAGDAGGRDGVSDEAAALAALYGAPPPLVPEGPQDVPHAGVMPGLAVATPGLAAFQQQQQQQQHGDGGAAPAPMAMAAAAALTGQNLNPMAKEWAPAGGGLPSAAARLPQARAQPLDAAAGMPPLVPPPAAEQPGAAGQQSNPLAELMAATLQAINQQQHQQQQHQVQQHAMEARALSQQEQQEAVLRRQLAAMIEDAHAKSTQTDQLSQLINDLQRAQHRAQVQELELQLLRSQAQAATQHHGPPPLLQQWPQQPHALPQSHPLGAAQPLPRATMAGGPVLVSVPPATPPRSLAYDERAQGWGGEYAVASPAAHTALSTGVDGSDLTGLVTPATGPFATPRSSAPPSARMAPMGSPFPTASNAPASHAGSMSRAAGGRFAVPAAGQGAPVLSAGKATNARIRLADRFLLPDGSNSVHFRHPRADPAKPHLVPPFGQDVKLEDIRLPPPPAGAQPHTTEQHKHRLRQRQKQIEFGMATQGYCNYLEAKRRGLVTGGLPEPRVPNIYQLCSKRSWDGQVRRWRQQLHSFDALSEKLWTADQLREIQERDTQDALRRATMPELDDGDGDGDGDGGDDDDGGGGGAGADGADGDGGSDEQA